DPCYPDSRPVLLYAGDTIELQEVAYTNLKFVIYTSIQRKHISRLQFKNIPDRYGRPAQYRPDGNIGALNSLFDIPFHLRRGFLLDGGKPEPGTELRNYRFDHHVGYAYVHHSVYFADMRVQRYEGHRFILRDYLGELRIGFYLVQPWPYRQYVFPRLTHQVQHLY